mgnify:CR=1 FL=1
MKKSLGIYIHIPFCVRKCKYCDFLSGPAGIETKVSYIELLLKEIEQYERILKERQTNTIFFGGGTPSILEGDAIVRIMEKLKELGNISETAEISIEANPGTVTEENLETQLAQSSMNLSYDDARKTAESFLEAAGINPSLLQVSLMKGILPSDSGNKYLEQSSISLESEYSAYHFVYNRVLEQAEIACTKQTSYQTDSKNENPASLAWNSETIDIIISDNGIEEIKWLHPLTKIKQLSDNSKLLSFENASAIFEKTAPVIYQNYLTQAKSSDLKQVYKLQVNSIKLSLLKIRDNEDEKSVFLVPAWIFYGTWEQKHDNSDKWKTYDESPYILLAINALDGSVIGPMDGYW